MASAKIFLSLVVLMLSVYSAKVTVPDNYTVIQEAIDKSTTGDTVFLRIGTYRENITLKDDISLIGESMTGTIISGNKKKPVINGSNNSIIKNLTVQNGRTGILAENAMFIIDQVVVRNNDETGIHCLVTLPYIYNCVISGNRASGILCESSRSIKTSVIHNVISENGYSGITLQGHSEILVMNNVIFANRQFGIWGSEESRKSRIIYNNFFNNRSAVNIYLVKDMSNTTDDPGFPLINGIYDYFSTSSVLLKGKGKDGATIGLVGGEVLGQKLTDPDEDNIPNDRDKCTSIPEDSDGFQDEDGCPEFDNDQDGIFDTEDACPNSPEDYDGFRDDDGCLDDDNDRDGVPDSIDVCNDSPETVNGYKDEDGCPDEIPPSESQTSPQRGKAMSAEEKSVPITPPSEPGKQSPEK